MAAKTAAKRKTAAKPRAKAKRNSAKAPGKALQERVDRIEQALTRGQGVNLTESDVAAVQAAAAEPTPDAKPLTFEERLCRAEIVLRAHGFYL